MSAIVRVARVAAFAAFCALSVTVSVANAQVTIIDFGTLSLANDAPIPEPFFSNGLHTLMLVGDRRDSPDHVKADWDSTSPLNSLVVQ